MSSAEGRATENRSWYRWLGLSALVVALDQLTKWYVTVTLAHGERVEVLPVFSWVRWHNDGAAFSFLAGSGGWQRWFFVALAAAFTVFIVYELRKLPAGDRLMGLVYGLILGGAWAMVSIACCTAMWLILFVSITTAGGSRPSTWRTLRCSAVPACGSCCCFWNFFVSDVRGQRPDEQSDQWARGPGHRDGRPGAPAFRSALESGEEIDTTRRSDPAMFTVGDGNLLPGFEAAILGMRAGDDAQILIEPEDAFGPHREENIQMLRRDRFGADLDLEVGLMVSFSGPGGELPGVVREVMEEHVEVDFNHPLAGRRIVFDVSIIDVRAPQLG